MQSISAICPLSGLPVQLSSYWLPDRASALHPVFLLSGPQLLRQIQNNPQSSLLSSYPLILASGIKTGILELSPNWFDLSNLRQYQIISESNWADWLSCLTEILSHPNLRFPSWKLDRSTPDSFLNLPDIIKNLSQIISDSKSEFHNTRDSIKLRSRLDKIERTLKSAKFSLAKYTPAYCRIISEWARLVGEFPQSTAAQDTPLGQLTLTDYWLKIISMAHNPESLYAVGVPDLEELREHLEISIPAGSQNYFDLLELIRRAEDSLRDTFGFTPRIKTRSSLAQFELVLDLPEISESEPQKENFSSKIDFILAHARWTQQRNAK